MENVSLNPLLTRIAEALERLAPAKIDIQDLGESDAFVWHAESGLLQAVQSINKVNIDLLQGIDSQRDSLLENTTRFTKGLPANNALLWGPEGAVKVLWLKRFMIK